MMVGRVAYGIAREQDPIERTRAHPRFQLLPIATVMDAEQSTHTGKLEAEGQLDGRRKLTVDQDQQRPAFGTVRSLRG